MDLFLDVVFFVKLGQKSEVAHSKSLHDCCGQFLAAKKSRGFLLQSVDSKSVCGVITE
jgi:hypothetical protein